MKLPSTINIYHFNKKEWTSAEITFFNNKEFNHFVEQLDKAVKGGKIIYTFSN